MAFFSPAPAAFSSVDEEEEEANNGGETEAADEVFETGGEEEGEDVEVGGLKARLEDAEAKFQVLQVFPLQSRKNIV